MSTLNGRALRTVEAKTANYAIVADVDNGVLFTNEGASGAVTFSLPKATPGQWFDFMVMAAQELRIDPHGSETISLPSGVQQAAGKYIAADAAGEYIRVVCVKEGQWNAIGGAGTWTAESS
jgi:hypothetical protein